VINLFYGEPDSDRWLAFDRYPRRLLRRLVRGKPRVGGQKRFFLNLCAGLDALEMGYRVNDYGHARAHPESLACIIGKPCVLDGFPWKNPILFGPAVYSHPVAAPNLLERLNIRRVLVPCDWMRRMCEPAWGAKVGTWAAGIDTELWKPAPGAEKTTDILLYDKIRWERERYERELLERVRAELRQQSRSFSEIRYGGYEEDTFHRVLGECRAMIFLCEHETQGFAYQQALACDVPILAWDRGGFWQDPEFYPHEVEFGPVTSVPYWDGRCGAKFRDASEFATRFEAFWQGVQTGSFQPRDYIRENLGLEARARAYAELSEECLK